MLRDVAIVLRTRTSTVAVVSRMKLEIPGGVCGSMDVPEQADGFRFEAKAQERLSFEVFARRLGSQLDAKLRILNAEGNALSEADDSTFDRVLSCPVYTSPSPTD